MNARFLLAPLLFFASAALAAAPDYRSMAQDFMGQLFDVAKLSKEKGGALSSESSAKVKDLSAKVDFNALAQRSFGPKRWSSFSKQDKQEFLSTLQELLEVVVYPLAQKIAVKPDQIDYRPAPKQPNEVHAQGEIEREKEGEIITQKIEVALVFDPKSKKVVDALIEGEKISTNLKRNLDVALDEKKQSLRDIIHNMQSRIENAKKPKKAA